MEHAPIRLEPCPWCWEVPRVREVCGMPARYTVRCEVAACPARPSLAVPAETAGDAVAAWNARRDVREIAGLRDALSDLEAEYLTLEEDNESLWRRIMRRPWTDERKDGEWER